MSYHCRTVKFTFGSIFAKKSFVSQPNASVNQTDFDRGMIQRIFLTHQKTKLSKSSCGLIKRLLIKE